MSLKSEMTLVVHSVGHSNRSLEDFIDLLKANQISRVVDVRTVPHSRHNPQFNRETLPESLRVVEIGYHHMPGLGGLRRPLRESINSGWRNASFQGFADYMQTEEFEENLKELVKMIGGERIALMCAEALPWRCHRSLIADALSLREIRVEHILSKTKAMLHSITPWAKVNGMHITYPTEESEGDQGDLSP